MKVISINSSGDNVTIEVDQMIHDLRLDDLYFHASKFDDTDPLYLYNRHISKPEQPLAICDFYLGDTLTINGTQAENATEAILLLLDMIDNPPEPAPPFSVTFDIAYGVETNDEDEILSWTSTDDKYTMNSVGPTHPRLEFFPEMGSNCLQQLVDTETRMTSGEPTGISLNRCTLITVSRGSSTNQFPFTMDTAGPQTNGGINRVNFPQITPVNPPASHQTMARVMTFDAGVVSMWYNDVVANQNNTQWVPGHQPLQDVFEVLRHTNQFMSRVFEFTVVEGILTQSEIDQTIADLTAKYTPAP